MSIAARIDDELERIRDARHHDPFAVLGRQAAASGFLIRAYLPGAAWVKVGATTGTQLMTRLANTDFFSWHDADDTLPAHYALTWQDASGGIQTRIDPYSFTPQVSEYDLHLFSEGSHWHIYRILGAHVHTADGIDGIRFAVWAPNAERVSVIGDFNQWDGRSLPMRSMGGIGVWELFVPGLTGGSLYKYEIRNRDSGQILEKADPYARQFERRPKTSSIVSAESTYEWQDADWLQAREQRDWQHAPLSIYEVHLGSWQRDADGNFLDYPTLADRLIDYVKQLGFTHIQLLPVTEHPFDGSWGYQCTGYFAPTSRFGSPDEFRYLVDRAHRHNIGVLLDWVPGHFPKDAHGLARFDGSAVYEHEDPRQGEHRDWGTLIFNYGRNEVRNFLLASAIYWLEEFHIDGLRVDAVASMLYLDYSREDGDWIPNIHGGNENLEAIAFLGELNEVTHGQHPGTLMIAEESTSWPQVTRPTWVGGLGFSAKWNMGWMHDTLAYLQKDPIYRHYHHDYLTFGMLYAWSENFVLPFSHDEVVHGKGSMIGQMPGDEWQRFANLRLLYTYMYTYPGKKLLFMGNEIAQYREWNHDTSLDWHLLEFPLHRGIQTLTTDLNRLYRLEPALFGIEFDASGFDWIDCHDASQSVLSYLRTDGHATVVVVLNFTPVPRHNYRLGVPHGGAWQEVFNSDSRHYGGSDMGNAGQTEAEAVEWMNRPWSINITVPPLAGVIFKGV